MAAPTLFLDDPPNRRRVFRYAAGAEFGVYLTELDDEGTVPIHRHVDQVEIMDIVEGEKVLSIGSRRKLLRAGEIELIPVNVPHGFLNDPVSPEESAAGPFRFKSFLIPRPGAIAPQLDVPVRRLVAARRDSDHRITAVQYDDGEIRTIAEALDDAERGLIEGVHVVRTRHGERRLRVHHALRSVVDLRSLPPIP